MPNPDGYNQFGGFGVDAPYGDVKEQFQLTREAPMSGAPISGHSLGTPDRQRQRQQKGKQQGQGGQQAPVALPQLPIPYDQQLGMIWQQIAAVPGASDLVRQIAGSANGGR